MEKSPHERAAAATRGHTTTRRFSSEAALAATIRELSGIIRSLPVEIAALRKVETTRDPPEDHVSGMAATQARAPIGCDRQGGDNTTDTASTGTAAVSPSSPPAIFESPFASLPHMSAWAGCRVSPRGCCHAITFFGAYNAARCAGTWIIMSPLVRSTSHKHASQQPIQCGWMGIGSNYSPAPRQRIDQCSSLGYVSGPRNRNMGTDILRVGSSGFPHLVAFC